MIFRLEYCNKASVTARVDIQKGWATPIYTVEGTAEPFVLFYNNDKGDKSGSFRSSGADINIYETAEFNIDELKTSNETEISVKYYINNILNWSGFVIPDFFSETITGGAGVVSMVASDRLGTLKGATLSGLSARVSNRELAEACLAQTGLSLPLYTMADFTGDGTNIFNSEVLSQRMVDTKGRNVSCYDILSSILEETNSLIVQRNGAWYIVNKLQLEAGSGSLYSSPVTSSAWTENTVSFDEVSVGARRTIKPVAATVGVYHEHGGGRLHPDNYDFSQGVTGWTSVNGFVATTDNREIELYSNGTPIYGDATSNDYLVNNNERVSGTLTLDTAPYLESASIPVVSTQSDMVDISIDVSITAPGGGSSSVTPSFVRYAVIASNGTQTYALSRSGTFEVYDPTNLDHSQTIFIGSDVWWQIVAVSKSQLINGKLEVDLTGFNVKVRIYGSGTYQTTAIHFASIRFSNTAELPKGNIFKTTQGANYTKDHEIPTVLWGDYLTSGLNGYFYDYPIDDTSSLYRPTGELHSGWTAYGDSDTLPLLQHITRQKSRMFSVAHDLLTADIDAVNFDPLSIFVDCNDKRYVVVSSKVDFLRSRVSVDLEEVAYTNNTVRDFIYSYFGEGESGIKSIGGISGGIGGGGGTGGAVADPRVSELKSYLDVVNTDLARLNETYNIINDSTVIGTMVKTQLNGLKDNLDTSSGAFISYATDALADGVLTEEEIEEIDTRKEAYLTAFGAFMAFAEPISISLIKVNILKDDLAKYAREKAQIDSVYPGLYGHTYLTGGTKVAYASAKTAYDTAYYDLVNTIDSYIFDGMVTPSESDQIQYYVGIYNTKIAEYKQAEENVKAIISLVTGYYEKLRTYAADKSRADNVYLLVYNNIYLVDEDETSYASAKSAYDTAYSDVVSGINTIISTGTLTPSEISAVSDLIDEYLSKLSLLIAAEETAREAIGEEQKRQAQVYAESLFDDVVETQTALENSLLKYSESINPITAQMMQLIVGDESLQFHFVESKVNPVRVSHSVSYLSGTLTVYAGWIKHLTLGITDISPAHEYKFWNVPLSAFGSLDPDKYYYLYAKCSTSAETGEYILSEIPIEIDGVSGYYHLLIGILNSENNSTRRFAQLYGFTEILPGRITTDKIVSVDGRMVIDLINNTITSPMLKISSGGVEKDVEEMLDKAGINVYSNFDSFNYPTDSTGALKGSLSDGAYRLTVKNGADFIPCGGTSLSPPAEGTYKVTSVTLPSGVTVAKSLSGGQFEMTPNSLTVDAAVIGITITVLLNGVYHTFDRSINYSKSRDGDDADMTEYEYLKNAIGQDAELTGALFTLVTILLKESMAADVTAGISGEQGANKDAPAFWSGGTYAQAIANAAKTILRHDGSGQLASGNISWDEDGRTRFEGAVSSPFIDATNVTTVEGFELYFNSWSNNFYVNSSTLKTLNIPDSADYNGQIVRIHNVGSAIVQLTADVSAIDNYIFWLPVGSSADIIQLSSGEAVEMVCVAISGVFHSWDVLRIYECRPL